VTFTWDRAPLVDPGRFQIADPAADLADDLVRLAVSTKAGRSRIVQAHGRDAFLGVQGIGAEPERLLDTVLQETVDDDDLAPDELLAPGHPLAGDQSVVDDELEVEAGG